MKTLCRLDNSIKTVISPVPDGCSGIAWSKAVKGVLFTENYESYLGSAVEGQPVKKVTPWMSSLHSPRGICVNDRMSVAHVEQECGKDFIVAAGLPGIIIREALSSTSRRNYVPRKREQGEFSLRVNGMCAITEYQTVCLASDRTNNILFLDQKGDVSIMIGSGKCGFSIGNDVKELMLNSPCGMAFEPSRKSLYVSDTGNHIVREFELAGGISHGRIAGRPTEEGYVDGEVHECMFSSPADITSARSCLFVVDAGKRIRRIDLESFAVSTAYESPGVVEAVTASNTGALYFTEVLANA